jgi:hypothetical protein
VSFADSLVGNFNLDTNLNTVASQGLVTFTLNGDGTIAAFLETYYNGIVGFGFNSAAVNIAESGFSPTAPDNHWGWTDSFGYQPSGFLCTACGFTESWTIGTPGEYTSVWQALDGGSQQSTVDFLLYDASEGQWGGDAQAGGIVPEPASFLMVAPALFGLAVFRRRFRS